MSSGIIINIYSNIIYKLKNSGKITDETFTEKENLLQKFDSYWKDINGYSNIKEFRENIGWRYYHDKITFGLDEKDILVLQYIKMDNYIN